MHLQQGRMHETQGCLMLHACPAVSMCSMMSASFCSRNWQMFWGACLSLVNECILIPLKLPAASLLSFGCPDGEMVRHQDDPVTHIGWRSGHVDNLA